MRGFKVIGDGGGGGSVWRQEGYDDGSGHRSSEPTLSMYGWVGTGCDSGHGTVLARGWAALFVAVGSCYEAAFRSNLFKLKVKHAHKSRTIF